MKNLIYFVLLSVVLSTIINGFSVYDMSKNHLSVKSLGMGTAYTAFAEGEAATLLNPAALSYPGSSYSFQQLDYDKLDYNLYQAHYYYNNPIGISSVIKEDFQGNKLTMNSVGLGVFSQNGVSWGLNYKSIFGNYDINLLKGGLLI